MNILVNKFLQCINSGHDFGDNELDLQNRHNIINISVFLAISGLIFGNMLNYIDENYRALVINTVAIIILFSTAVALRFLPKYFELITTAFAIEYLILFNLLLFVSEPSDLKHMWILTFPSLIFFYKGSKIWVFWVSLLIITLYLTKLQPFYEIAYSLRDITYLNVVVLVMTVVIYFYKDRIDSGNELIREQKDQLETLTEQLEKKVSKKTLELEELNAHLEQKIEDKARELTEKDAFILAQSRQAAMGEMISMIAHQWRQPLSTITLEIANIKINTMLGNVSISDTNDALEKISKTIIYLSDTIDDFQSFFRPNKDKELTSLCQLVERGVNFTEPRLKILNVNLEYTCNRPIMMKIHSNEFTQVIINILNNAIDALEASKVKKPFIKITNIVSNNGSEIHICDNAGGVTPENMHKIFEPYFSTKGKNGTGLGLYMSSMIIEKELFGKLEVINNDEGAEFIIKIPVVSQIIDEERMKKMLEQQESERATKA